jgi:polyhydroxybutyrate depolymerase
MKLFKFILCLFLFSTFLMACNISNDTPSGTAPAIKVPTDPFPKEGSVRFGAYYGNIISSGIRRTFTIHIPPGYTPQKSYPLVIDFHGLDSSAEVQDAISQMSSKGEIEGFLVLNPQALGNPAFWNLEPENNSDQVFVRDLVSYLQTRLNIDTAKIYTTGFSNGGGMAERLACSLSDLVAAAAPVAGGYLYWQDCNPSRPVPIISFHGTADVQVPYYGAGDIVPLIPDWASAWAHRNGCDPTPGSSVVHGNLTIDSWGNCQQDATVSLYTIYNGDHSWPGSYYGTQDFQATDIIWEFFKKHPYPPDS